MKIFKKIIAAAVTLLLVFSLAACAEAPYIGENGNWFVGGEDTGVAANGIKGDTGPQGEGVDVRMFTKLSSTGTEDTYRLIFTDGTETTITLKKGITPTVTSFEPIGESDGDVVYALTFSTGAVATLKFKGGEDGKDGANTVETLNIIYSATVGNAPIVATAKTLKSGAKLELENNTVMNNKHLTLSVDIADIGDGIIRVGHGYDEFSANCLEIDKDTVKVLSGGKKTTDNPSGITEVLSKSHGFSSITGNLKVIIDVNYGKANIQVLAEGQKIFSVKDVNWSGRNGTIFAQPVGVNVTNVNFSWSCDDYASNIYMMGDSYFSSRSADRWPGYLFTNGYMNQLMLAYPGMGTAKGLSEFKQALTHGTPEFAFWCMGMNNGDSGSGINEVWLECTEEFLAICEEKGITPILSTIPNTPTANNSYKNEWVKEWAEETGGRFVDFAKAVGSDIYDESLIGKTYTKADGTEATNTTGYTWYNGMLHADLIHPDTLGAQALYMQAIIDFPELLQN